MKISSDCTKQPYYFLTIDTTLPASYPLRFRKKLFLSYKNAVTGQIKTLDRKAAKIYTLSSGNLDKYEYLTDENLNQVLLNRLSLIFLH